MPVTHLILYIHVHVCVLLHVQCTLTSYCKRFRMSLDHKIIIKNGISNYREKIYKDDCKISGEKNREDVSRDTVNNTL